MKLLDILKTVGAGIIRNTVPGGGLIVAALNEVLPTKHRLDPKSATGDDINSAVHGLDPVQRQALLTKEFDVDIAEIVHGNRSLQIMLENDNGESTRPAIAMGAFRVIAFCNIAIVSLWFWGVVDGKPLMVDSIVAGWPLIASINAPLVVVLRSYFGNLVKEKQNKLHAAGGHPPTAGIIGSIVGLLAKR